MQRHTLIILLIFIIGCFTANATMCVPAEHLYDAYNTDTYFLNWTPDGQLKTIAAPCRGYIRNHKWNDAGQLAAVVDNNHCGFYAYDGNGERVYKLTGASLVRQINAGNVVFVSGYDDEVVYVNPYMVLTPQGYTKHYYKGKERLAARVVLASENDLSVVFSNQLSIPINTSIVKERRANALSYFNFIHSAEEQLNFHQGQTFISSDGAAYDQLQWECVDNDRLTFTHYVVADSNLIAPMFLFSNPLAPNHQSLYYYHADHLGSANWITDASGMPMQFIHYQPYGELYINYKTTAYDERFKFTGKERDAETDYDYFGARYYASICPSFISVDPLADNYPGLNPYAYCGWNPVMYVDPDGNWIESAWDFANLVMDINSLVDNIQNGNVGDAIVDATGLLLDAAATIIPGVPGGAGTAIKTTRAAGQVVDVVNKSRKVNQIAPRPNNGIAKPHGGIKHNSSIDKEVDNIRKQGGKNIRKNQVQVDVNGNRVGNNRPDIQYDINGEHHNIEFDTKEINSNKHNETIRNNDPNSQVHLHIIE